MKFNKNIILFVAVMVFILTGFTMGHFSNIKYALISFLTQNEDAAEDLSALFKSMDEISTDQLRYHSEMMNVDSAKQRLLNTSLIQKAEDEIIVRTDSDSLVELQTGLFTDENLDTFSNNVAQLQDATQANGAEFLYVIAPRKTLAMDVPEHATDDRRENVSALIGKLDEKNVNTLNLCEVLKEEGRLNDSLFFKTDHHWKPEVGFWAAGEICRSLNERYGFEYDSRHTDLSNFNVTTYKDCFLGSYGKKIGLYYVPGGAEDFNLITPKFETDFTDYKPYKDETRTGDFQNALLYMENIQEVDYFNQNPYATYSGGDFRLQILTNNLNPEGKKVLIIRDSFACVVTPFLALNAGELHIVDNRDFLEGDYIDIHDYIEEIDPDYVMVLYGGLEGLPDGEGRFNFDLP